MTDKEIIDFRNNVKNLSVEELKKQQAELQEEISRMIMNSDVMVRAAILESLIQEKTNGKTE